ncbi:MAG: type II toxin-antitoxin system RelE/ParE family toxin [Acetobacteraceae bacterium]
MSYTVRFAPEVQDQLAAIERHIAEAGSPVAAVRYVDAIITYCEGLVTFPQRGRKRDDLVPGLRITNYRGSAVIAFVVDTEAELVSIVGVFYGGQDYDTQLLQDR